MKDNKHPNHKGLDYNYITDGIYIGTNACCQVHFDERLADEGIEADVSVEGEQVDSPFGVEMYLWLPVKDHYAPTPEQFDIGVHALEKLVTMDKKIYVHCEHGHGRAPTLVAAYLIKQGKTVEEALATIKEKRPVIHPWDRQIESLEDYAKANQ